MPSSSDCQDKAPSLVKMTMESVKSFGCEECGEIMTSNSRLIQHMLSHRGVTIFCCEECEEVFLSESHMDQHILALHTDAETYNCETCNRPFTSQQSLSIHRTSTHQDPMIYEELKAGWMEEGEHMPGNTHTMQEIVANDDGEFKCEKCQGTFYYKADLLRHLKRVRCHRFKNKCSVCSALFFRASTLAQHMFIHQVEGGMVKIESSQDQMEPYEGATEEQTGDSEEEEELKCNKCKGRFAWKGDLVRHQRTVRCQRFKYRCDICGALFFRQAFLSQHMNIDHDQEHEATIKTENNVDQRVQVSHTVAKSYKCEVCGRSFISQNSLSTHRSTHGGPRKHKEDRLRKVLLQRLQTQRRKIFKCKICGGTFISPKNLEKHQKWSLCHKFRFKCSICGAQFYRASYRYQHMLIAHPQEYTPHADGDQRNPMKISHSLAEMYKCEMCLRSFTSQQALSKHKVMHNAVKKYKKEPFSNILLGALNTPNRVYFMCKRCGQTFKVRKNLFIHQKSNKCQVYKHKCKVCMASFFRQEYLKEHVMIAHTGKCLTIKKEDE